MTKKEATPVPATQAHQAQTWGIRSTTEKPDCAQQQQQQQQQHRKPALRDYKEAGLRLLPCAAAICTSNRRPAAAMASATHAPHGAAAVHMRLHARRRTHRCVASITHRLPAGVTVCFTHDNAIYINLGELGSISATVALRQATFQAPIPLPRMDNWHDGPRSIDGSINWLRRPSKALVSGWAARYARPGVSTED